MTTVMPASVMEAWVVLRKSPAVAGGTALKDVWRILYPPWEEALLARGSILRGLKKEQRAEAIQEFFLHVFLHWDRFREKETLEDLFALSRKVMHDKVIDLLRQACREHHRPLDALLKEMLAAGPSEGDYLAEAEEKRRRVDDLLLRLERVDPGGAKLVRAHVLERRSKEALAAEKKCSVHAIECRLSRAFERLRRLFGEALFGMPR